MNATTSSASSAHLLQVRRYPQLSRHGERVPLNLKHGLALLAAPYAQLVPLAATAPALILVGALMMAPLADVPWDEPDHAIPAFLTVAMIPLTFSIANGLAFGITAHAVLQILRGRAGTKDAALLILAGLFVIRFVWLSAG